MQAKPDVELNLGLEESGNSSIKAPLTEDSEIQEMRYGIFLKHLTLASPYFK